MTSHPANRLSRQLLTNIGLSVIAVGLTTLGFNYRLMQLDLQEQVNERALSITHSLEFSTEGLLELGNTTILRRVVQNFATMPGVVEIAIVDPSGVAIARSPENATNQPYRLIYPQLAQVIEQAATTGVETNQQTLINGKPVIVQVLPFRSSLFGLSERRGVAIAIINLKQMQQAVNQTFFKSTLLLLIGIISILLFISILLGRTVLTPMRHLNNAVIESKEKGSFPMPCGLPSNEIQFLAKTFDEVFRQLLEVHQQLKAEIVQRQQVEVTLRESEHRERIKSQQLQQTLEFLKHTQSQLIQSEKIASLGQLVAGIAHEVNNPVNFIHGNISHIQEDTQQLVELIHLYQQEYPNPSQVIKDKIEETDLEFINDDLPKLLSSMLIGTERIRDIVKSLRIFSRLDEAEVKTVDIHEGINSTLLILQHRFQGKPDRREIEVIKDYSQLPVVECYAGQLNQVFMNILVNAIDALEESSLVKTNYQPVITIGTELIDIQWVKIAIADNGSGISEVIQSRIFDPFFTTKAVGKGTGMGMSISYQIVTGKHGGKLYCQSALGQGAKFIIEIPVRQSIVKTATTI